MGYSVVPTVATGDLWTAANHNTYIRDNFAGGVPAIFSAAGDMAYASGAGAAASLPVGAIGKTLKVLSSGLPGWGGAIVKRRGFSPTVWDNEGTNIYTVDDILVLIGYSDCGVLNGGARVTKNIYFQLSQGAMFSATPLALISLTTDTGQKGIAQIRYISSSLLQIDISNLETSGSFIPKIHWMVIGPPL